MPITSPVAGLVVSTVSPDAAGPHSPSTNMLCVFVCVELTDERTACGALARSSALIICAHFSPIIIVVMHGLIAGRNGMIDPSAIRSPRTPFTRRPGSTTASGSSGAPIRAVHAGW